jgi:ABC-type sulfate/molybdate transport systems ATPase subunit
MAALAIDLTLPRRGFLLDLALELGSETVAVIGASGAGKTSLLRAVAGLERPQRGSITLDGEAWFEATTGVNVTPERRRVGYVPQDYGLFPHMSVARNVRFAGGRPRPDLLERFGITHLADARPSSLSGGERQRAALARALARDPRVLLLDEPFAALDVMTRARVRDELVLELQALVLPTLLVTHAFEDASALASRVAVLEDGRLAQLASPSQLLANPATAAVAALTGANVVSAIAQPSENGALLTLDGGGELASATRAEGRITVAIHPWDLTLTDPATALVTDRVIRISPHAGATQIRLTRFTVLTQDRSVALSEGEIVGLTATPTALRLFDADTLPAA